MRASPPDGRRPRERCCATTLSINTNLWISPVVTHSSKHCLRPYCPRAFLLDCLSCVRSSYPRFYRSKQRLVHKVARHASRFLVSGRCPISHVGEGRQGSQRSAREAGIGKETGYRWLREAYVAHRRGGKSIAETEAVMGLASAKSIAWEAEVAAGPGRHHLRVAVDAEARFWAVYDAGSGADAAASAAGVGRSTGYRWLDRRFFELRAAGFTVKGAQRLLRLTDQVTATAERLRAAASFASGRLRQLRMKRPYGPRGSTPIAPSCCRRSSSSARSWSTRTGS